MCRRQYPNEVCNRGTAGMLIEARITHFKYLENALTVQYSIFLHFFSSPLCLYFTFFTHCIFWSKLSIVFFDTRLSIAITLS